VANAIVTEFLNGQLGKGTYTAIDFEADTTLKFALIDHATHTPLPASDTWYSDFNAGLIGALSAALATRTVGTVGAGVFDAADLAPAWTTTSGASVESINLIKDTGTPTTSPYICYWDTGTGLPLTPNGGDINLTFNASGIFKI
jgi:hypothetical protein